jgi:putative serine protease PepD
MTRETTSARRGSVRLLVLVALVALVVGGIGGFLGTRLGRRQPAAVSSPTPTPTATSPTATSHTATPSPTVRRSSAKPSKPPATTGDRETVRIAKKLRSSTVTITAITSNSRDIGSGFAIDGHGRIMTNNHVIASAAKGGKIRVTFGDGHHTRAKIVGRSPGYDLAILHVKNQHGLSGVSFGNSDHTKVGQSAVAIGSPYGLGGTVTAGIISAIHRPVAVGGNNAAEQKQAYLNAVQTDAAINVGNSGGPLADNSGKVIGVNSAILTGDSDHSGTSSPSSSGLGFAIPIDQARQISKMLIKKGYATYPVINANVSDSRSGTGVRLTRVDPHGAAHHAGLRAGDVITAIGGKRVNSPPALIVSTRSHRPGDQVRMKYRRNGKHRKTKVRLRSERG